MTHELCTARLTCALSMTWFPMMTPWRWNVFSSMATFAGAVARRAAHNCRTLQFELHPASLTLTVEHLTTRVQYVHRARSRAKVRALVVQPEVVAVVNVTPVFPGQAKDLAVHADREVLPIHHYIANGVDVVPTTVGLSLPAPLRQPSQVAAVNQGKLVLADGMLPRQPDPRGSHLGRTRITAACPCWPACSSQLQRPRA